MKLWELLLTIVLLIILSPIIILLAIGAVLLFFGIIGVAVDNSSIVLFLLFIFTVLLMGGSVGLEMLRMKIDSNYKPWWDTKVQEEKRKKNNEYLNNFIMGKH